MKKYAVITTANEKIYKDYGRENIETFLKYWPKEIKIHVFLEDYMDKDFKNERLVFYDLHKSIPELLKLKTRNSSKRETPLFQNKKILESVKTKPHKDKSYLFDYVRFANKGYVIIYGLQNIMVDYLIWLDMDVKTIREIPYSFLEKICPNDCLVSFLKRKIYTETGFLAFNRNHPRIKEYINIAKDIYDNDRIYTIEYFQSGYTDCHVFDYTINKITSNGDVKLNNLNVFNDESHPFINSELGIYMDHFKGERRKKTKRSDPSEIRNKMISSSNPEYWKK